MGPPHCEEAASIPMPRTVDAHYLHVSHARRLAARSHVGTLIAGGDARLGVALNSLDVCLQLLLLDLFGSAHLTLDLGAHV